MLIGKLLPFKNNEKRLQESLKELDMEHLLPIIETYLGIINKALQNLNIYKEGEWSRNILNIYLAGMGQIIRNLDKFVEITLLPELSVLNMAQENMHTKRLKKFLEQLYAMTSDMRIFLNNNLQRRFVWQSKQRDEICDSIDRYIRSVESLYR